MVVQWTSEGISELNVWNIWWFFRYICWPLMGTIDYHTPWCFSIRSDMRYCLKSVFLLWINDAHCSRINMHICRHPQLLQVAVCYAVTCVSTMTLRPWRSIQKSCISGDAARLLWIAKLISRSKWTNINCSSFASVNPERSTIMPNERKINS